MIALLLLVVGATVALGEAYGYFRAVTTLVGGWALLYLGVSYFRSAGEAPPEPDAEDVGDQGLRYVCSVCGLELKVEIATSDRAPTHCREKMELIRGDQPRPALRPLE